MIISRMKVGGPTTTYETIWPARLNFFSNNLLTSAHTLALISLDAIGMFSLMIAPGRNEKIGCKNIHFGEVRKMAGGRKWPEICTGAQAEMITFFPEMLVLHGPVNK